MYTTTLDQHSLPIQLLQLQNEILSWSYADRVEPSMTGNDSYMSVMQTKGKSVPTLSQSWTYKFLPAYFAQIFGFE